MVVDKAIVKTRAYLDQAHLNATNLVVRNVVIFSNAVETRALEKFCNDYNFTGNVMVWKGLSRKKKKKKKTSNIRDAADDQGLTILKA